MMIASCSGDKSVRIWKMNQDVTSWTCIHTLDDAHKRTIRSVAYSPSGALLATGGFDATTAIWEKSASGICTVCFQNYMFD
jgi:WD40 repeat protein